MVIVMTYLHKIEDCISDIDVESLIVDIDSQLRSIMELWSERCVDEQYGGYLTSYDRTFTLSDTNKGAWGQARHIYTYSAMAEYDQPNRQRWQALAKVGIDFTFNTMSAGNNRINYLVSQSGDEVLEGTTSIFSDAFAIGGLAKYIDVFKSTEYIVLLKDMYEQLVSNVLNPAFKDIAPAEFNVGVCHHSVHMIAINTAYLVGKVLGEEYTHDFIEECLRVIFTVLVDTDSNCLLEKKRRDGSFESSINSHFVNVGHTFESMWFCLEIAIERKDIELIRKIEKISECTYVRGSDQGLLSYSFDLSNRQTAYTTWKYEYGFLPKDKVGWTYAESLVLFIKLFEITKDKKWFDRFIVLKKYIDEHFIDKDYGDWFHALHEDGSVKIDIKGSTIKNAYHMPRAYLKILDVLQGIGLD